MQLGEFEIHSLNGGRFRIDGGTMFGVVPKALWEKQFPADGQNRIAQATNCFLVKAGEKTILIETGLGSKLSERRRQIFAAEPGDPLLADLAAHGLSPEDIDCVILSHLHFDHAGGATSRDEAGEIVATFPNAEYVVQRAEWDIAMAELPELRGAYPQENIVPLEKTGRLRLLEGDDEILPGFRAVVTGGHTTGHQAIIIESGDESALFIGDVCPSSRHLPMNWCMAYDVDLLQTRRIKQHLLTEAARRGTWILWDHDPDVVASRIESAGSQWTAADSLAKI